MVSINFLFTVMTLHLQPSLRSTWPERRASTSVAVAPRHRMAVICFLVAPPLVPDLLLRAKDLFVGATMVITLRGGTPWHCPSPVSTAGARQGLLLTLAER